MSDSDSATCLVERVTPAALARADVIIADVRSQADFDKGHYDKAISLSFPQILWRRLVKQKSKAGCLDDFLMSETQALKRRHEGTFVILYDDGTRDLADCACTAPLRILCDILSLESGTKFAFVEGGFKAISRAFPESIVLSHFTSYYSPSAATTPHQCHSPMAPAAKALDFIWGFMAIGSEVDAANVALLDTEGVSHILNLTTNHSSRDVLNTRTCLQVPLYDTQSQDILSYLPQALDFIHTARQSGGRILVHCAAGISRSPAFAMAYCMWQGPMSLTDAFALIREHRTVASPNLNFMGQLLLFGRCLCPSSLEITSPNATTTPRQASLLATICLRKSPHASPPNSSPSVSPSATTTPPTATTRDTHLPSHHLVSAN